VVSLRQQRRGVLPSSRRVEADTSCEPTPAVYARPPRPADTHCQVLGNGSKLAPGVLFAHGVAPLALSGTPVASWEGAPKIKAPEGTGAKEKKEWYA
jgi:hypothetical protein